MADPYTQEGLPKEELQRLRDTPPTVQRTDLICADCGAFLQLKLGRYGRFYGCATYPSCKGAVTADDNGEPLGYPADEETRRSRHRFIRAKKFAMKRRTYSGVESRRVLNRPNGFSVGFLDKRECEELIAHLCQQTPGLEKFLNDLPALEETIVRRSRWDRLMDPLDIFEMEAPLDGDDVEDVERGMAILRRVSEPK